MDNKDMKKNLSRFFCNIFKQVIGKTNLKK